MGRYYTVKWGKRSWLTPIICFAITQVRSLGKKKFICAFTWDESLQRLTKAKCTEKWELPGSSNPRRLYWKDWLFSITRYPRTSVHSFGSGGKDTKENHQVKVQPLYWGPTNQVHIRKREVIQETSEMLVAAQTYHNMEGGRCRRWLRDCNEQTWYFLR